MEYADEKNNKSELHNRFKRIQKIEQSKTSDFHR